LSITHSALVAQGMTSNMTTSDDAFTRDGGGLVDYARVNKITLQARAAIQIGHERGIFVGSPDYPELNAESERLSVKYGVEPVAIACAWITRHPANMQVVLGTTTPSRIADAAAGSDIRLTRAEWYGLLQAAGHKLP